MLKWIKIRRDWGLAFWAWAAVSLHAWRDYLVHKCLIELAEKARLDLLQDNSDQSKLHDELKKVKEDWEAQQKLAEQKKREWEEEQKRLNGGNLPPEEKTKQLEELKKNAEDEIEKMRQKNAATQESQQKTESKLKEKRKESKLEESASDFAEASLESNEKDRPSIGKQFTSAADPSVEKPAVKNENSDGRESFDPNKQAKISVT